MAVFLGKMAHPANGQLINRQGWQCDEKHYAKSITIPSVLLRVFSTVEQGAQDTDDLYLTKILVCLQARV